METDPLKGDPKGFSILTVTGHWRLTFRYDEATGRGLSPNPTRSEELAAVDAADGGPGDDEAEFAGHLRRESGGSEFSRDLWTVPKPASNRLARLAGRESSGLSTPGMLYCRATVVAPVVVAHAPA